MVIEETGDRSRFQGPVCCFWADYRRHSQEPSNEYRGQSIVYSGDTSSKTDNMILLADDADLLIYDTVIMDDLPDGPNDAVFFALHTTPTRIGEVAAAAQPKRLILSHITPIPEPRVDEIKSIIRAQG